MLKWTPSESWGRVSSGGFALHLTGNVYLLEGGILKTYVSFFLFFFVFFLFCVFVGGGEGGGVSGGQLEGKYKLGYCKNVRL